MRLQGKVWKDGRFWLIEIPMLDIMTQGTTKKEAFEMIKDATEELINKEGVQVNVHPGKGDYFEISADTLELALLLKRQRQMRGLTLKEAVAKIGQKSHNAYARYEQAKADPTIGKLTELLNAVNPGKDFVITES